MRALIEKRTDSYPLSPQVRKYRASADALSDKLAGRECGDQAAAAERDQLRAAVRELGQGSDSKAEAAKLHEKVARARAKEVRDTWELFRVFCKRLGVQKPRERIPRTFKRTQTLGNSRGPWYPLRDS